MRTEPDIGRLRLDGPLGFDGLTVRGGEFFWLLQRVSVEEIRAILDKDENRRLRARPVYFARIADDEAWLWPTPDAVYEVVRAPR